jgi:hypothetical protein
MAANLIQLIILIKETSTLNNDQLAVPKYLCKIILIFNTLASTWKEKDKRKR